ncbi:pyridoxal phosphate-dependent aminotransferase [Streptomyces albireticuli]|uniref:pyridoxal phosphate-dependent aminotransferase n=1 Tax=Streptomyces albireticuli TaxID=1940 RepID=UPI0036CFC542
MTTHSANRLISVVTDDTRERRPTPLRRLGQSAKLADVCYDIRGPVLQEAMRLERTGRRILKLNTGNPAAFGFEAPPEIVRDIQEALASAHGYGDAQGLPAARRAVVQHYETRGVGGMDIEDVYLGNGVSELIQMSMQALLDDGDEVLVPAPDYPLWTASVSLSGGRPVHYRCDEGADWFPDLADIEAKVSDRTKAIVLINPNNPTGAVYDEELLRGIVGIAARHQLVLCADEIYDKILYDGAGHTPLASLAPDLLCLTFNGLSKAYRVCGYRAGWMAVSGPKAHAREYLEGLTILANMRLCPNMPSQHAIATALGGRQSVEDLVLPGGRLLAQRDAAWRALSDIPGVSCVKPRGALYAFPKLDRSVHRIEDDRQFVLDLLRQEQILVVQGTGFNLPTPDHFRLVTLPGAEELTDAVTRIGSFLATYRQN